MSTRNKHAPIARIAVFSLASIVIGSSSLPAVAQTVVNASAVVGQPTVRRDDNGFASCGVRLVVQVDRGINAEIYDFSLNLSSEIFKGMLKAGKYSVPRNAKSGLNFEKRKVAMPGPESYWFAEQTEGIPLRPIFYSPARDEGFTMAVAEFEKSARTILAITEGKRMQFAYRYKGVDLEQVVAIKPDLKEDDRLAIVDCVIGLGKRIERDLQQSATPEH